VISGASSYGLSSLGIRKGGILYRRSIWGGKGRGNRERKTLGALGSLGKWCCSLGKKGKKGSSKRRRRPSLAARQKRICQIKSLEKHGEKGRRDVRRRFCSIRLEQKKKKFRLHGGRGKHYQLRKMHEKRGGGGKAKHSEAKKDPLPKKVDALALLTRKRGVKKHQTVRAVKKRRHRVESTGRRRW